VGSLLWKRSGLLLHSLFRDRVIRRTIDREQDQRVLEQWSSTPVG